MVFFKDIDFRVYNPFLVHQKTQEMDPKSDKPF
jgi:hypothetical protein